MINIMRELALTELNRHWIKSGKPEQMDAIRKDYAANKWGQINGVRVN